MASAELLHAVIMPREIPSVLQSRGYDEAQLVKLTVLLVIWWILVGLPGGFVGDGKLHDQLLLNGLQ